MTTHYMHVGAFEAHSGLRANSFHILQRAELGLARDACPAPRLSHQERLAQD
jgi:hypothetical protein